MRDGTKEVARKEEFDQSSRLQSHLGSDPSPFLVPPRSYTPLVAVAGKLEKGGRGTENERKARQAVSLKK